MEYNKNELNKVLNEIESDNNKDKQEKAKKNKKGRNLIRALLGIILIIIAMGMLFIIYDYVYGRYGAVADMKPIIYLYPTEDMQVSVKLKYNNNIIVSYPEYSNGWNVLAKTNGTMTDLVTNRELYSLYYESENVVKFKMEKDGFVINKNDLITFFEEKLATLGLTEREAEEFIIYWLPILQKNEYNYIRFATTEEIEENTPLEIEPKPDTTIRILMTYKGLKKPIEIEEQKLVTPERNGFTAVEWGGTEIE